MEGRKIFRIHLIIWNLDRGDRESGHSENFSLHCSLCLLPSSRWPLLWGSKHCNKWSFWTNNVYIFFKKSLNFISPSWLSPFPSILICFLGPSVPVWFVRKTTTTVVLIYHYRKQFSLSLSKHTNTHTHIYIYLKL